VLGTGALGLGLAIVYGSTIGSLRRVSSRTLQ
jgi:hypothetical protein